MKTTGKLLLLLVLLASCSCATNERVILLKGVQNARELGGLVMKDGRSIVHGKLVRSGDLSEATDKDVAILKDRFHLTDVFDFRVDTDLEEEPDRVIDGVRYTHLSTLPPAYVDGFSSGSTDTTEVESDNPLEALTRYAFDPGVQQMVKDIYPAILTDSLSRKRYGEFLKGVLNAEGGVLWHCSQGKDRAGWGTAFVLAALGASRETIVEDFDLSNKPYAKYVKYLSSHVRKMGGGEAEVAFIRATVGASVEYFERALDLIDTQYGSLSAYLEEALGLTAQEQQLLRDKYLK